MTGRRLHAQALRVRAALDARALAVLATLQRVRLLTTAQVQRLFVCDGVPSARGRRTQSLLKRLQGNGLVIRLSRRIGGVRAGSSGFIYGLSALGHAVLDSSRAAPARRRRTWETTPHFQDHLLAVSELYVALRERERLGHAALLGFSGEPACWRSFSGSGGELVMVKPDSFIRIGFPTVERRVFVEVDLATESLPTVVRKSARYVSYWRSGREQQRAGVFPQVVWLVPTEHRRQNIERALAGLAADATGLFVVGLLRVGAPLLMTPPPGADDLVQPRSRPPP